jgi:hypothetical protein
VQPERIWKLIDPKNSQTFPFFQKNQKLRFKAQSFFFLPSIISKHLQKQEAPPETGES